MEALNEKRFRKYAEAMLMVYYPSEKRAYTDREISNKVDNIKKALESCLVNEETSLYKITIIHEYMRKLQDIYDIINTENLHDLLNIS